MSKMDNTFEWKKNSLKKSNYYTKIEIDAQQAQQDKFITANSENIVKVNNKINETNNNFDNYYNKSEIDNQQNSQNETIEALQTNLTDNYYTKLEIDAQQQLQDNKINDNASEIRQIGNIVNDLQDKVNINTTNIESNYGKIQELFKRPRFYKGQVLFFDTKQSFLDIIATPLNLQENIDFETIEPNRYLLTGTSNITGGSNLITEKNLPYKEWSINIDTQWATGYGKNSPTIYAGTNSSVGIQTITTNYDLQTKTGVSGNKYTPKWSYGNDTPAEFLPKFQMIYAVKFLKNIK